MSTAKMLDMCVKYIARRHHLLTEEQVALLDAVWDTYEPSLPPLPPSPPPERQHVRFDEHEQPKQPKQPSRPRWPCHRCMDEEVWECGQCVFQEMSPEEVEKERQREKAAHEYQEELKQLYEEQQEQLRQEQEEQRLEAERIYQEQQQEQQEQEEEQHEEDCDCSVCSYEDAQEDLEWQEKRRATLADFATLQKEAEYQAQLREEAEEQAEYYREQREEAALWRQIPQGAPVSQSMQHKETCGCDICEWQDRRLAEEEAAEAKEQEQEQEQWRQQEREWQQQYEEQQQLPCCSDYLRSCDADGCTYECAAPCGSSEPVIDLTCDKASCEYGCDASHHPTGTAYPLPPIESCLYGCSFNCGANPGEDCKAEFDEDGDQLPALVASVAQAAINSDDDDMPALIPIGSCATPRGWYNPEEAEDDTEIVDATPQPVAKTPKAKPLFPYNHPRWPSPRAKALVQWMIRRGRTSKGSISYALKEPGDKSIKGLTHDICMRYLAKFHKLSHEELMEKTIYELHNPDPHTPYWHRCPCPFCKGGYTRGYCY